MYMVIRYVIVQRIRMLFQIEIGNDDNQLVQMMCVGHFRD